MVSPTSTPEENSETASGSAGTTESMETAETAKSEALGSDARRTDGLIDSGMALENRNRPTSASDTGDQATERSDEKLKSRGGGRGNNDRRNDSSSNQGRLRLKWGFDVDIPVRKADISFVVAKADT